MTSSEIFNQIYIKPPQYTAFTPYRICPIGAYNDHQYHDFDKFISDIDLIVIMVKHNQIKENIDTLRDKIVLDCHNICNFPGVYHI